MRDPVLFILGLAAVGLFVIYVLIAFIVKVTLLIRNLWKYGVADGAGDKGSARSRDRAVRELLTYLDRCDRPLAGPGGWESGMSEALENLCDQYLLKRADVREEIRRFFVGRPRLQSHLLFIFYQTRKAIASEGNSRELRLSRLRRGLAATSMEDLRYAHDLQGMYGYKFELAKLYQAAERAGLDAEGQFSEVAKLSSGEAGLLGYPSLKSILAGARLGFKSLEEAELDPECSTRSSYFSRQRSATRLLAC